MDVYLNLGRNISTVSGNSKVQGKPSVGTSDRWLEASIELTSLIFLLGKDDDLFEAIDFDLNS